MKKIKRILAISLSALLLVGVMAIPAFAEEEELKGCTVSVEADKAEANVGDTVNVSVVLGAGARIGAITAHLLYDECFEYVKGSGACPAEGVMASINEDVAGELIISIMKEGNIGNAENKTVLLTASFKVLKTNGVFDLFLETVGADDDDTTEITDKCTHEGLTIIEPKDDEGQTGDDDEGQTGDDDEGQIGDDDEGQTGDDDEGQTGDDDEGQTKPEDEGKAPKTGDSSDVMLWVVLAALAMGGAAYTVRRKRV